MLLAPALPSPPSTTSTTSPFTLTPSASSLSSSTSRSINGSTATVLGISSTTSTTPARENGAREFSIFKDDGKSGVDENLEGGKWEDLGTIKSRRRENDIEATEWKGETMIMGGRAVLPVVARMEVFRDDVSLVFLFYFI